MANILYDSAREKFLTANLNWLSETIKAILVDTGAYTVSAAHSHLSDIPGGAIIGSAVTLSNKSATGGAADANDLTFSTVSGTTIEAVVLYVESGSAATSQLIAYIDSATGLPISPNGGDIIVTWDNGPNKIFRV